MHQDKGIIQLINWKSALFHLCLVNMFTKKNAFIWFLISKELGFNYLVLKIKTINKNKTVNLIKLHVNLKVLYGANFVNNNF